MPEKYKSGIARLIQAYINAGLGMDGGILLRNKLVNL
jgi:hypothetical protein